MPTTNNQSVTITTTSALSMQRTIAATETQNMTVAPTASQAWRWARTLLQNINVHLAQAEQTTYHTTLAQAVDLAQLFTRSFPATLTQNMTVHQAASLAIGVHLLQNLHAHQSDAEQVTYHSTLTQVVHLTQLLIRSYPTTLTQNMTVHQAASLALAVKLLQNMTVKPAHIPVVEYHLALAQAILVNSALGRFLAEILTQNMTAHFALAKTYVTSPTLTQAMTVDAGLANTLVLTLNQNIDLSPTEVLQAIYNGQLTDNIAMKALYISPSGTVTTWAINTRTTAVTEYTNYNFNSFAQMGLKYIAANSSGIYELDGDTDAGTSITADIISGLMQMNGSKLSGIKGLYLAVRGGGQFFLKVINGDGREYLYEVLGQPGLMTSKVNVGKGLRTRYVAFQLTSTGQDFDVDSLEFVPMLSDRRV